MKANLETVYRHTTDWTSHKNPVQRESYSLTIHSLIQKFTNYGTLDIIKLFFNIKVNWRATASALVSLKRYYITNKIIKFQFINYAATAQRCLFDCNSVKQLRENKNLNLILYIQQQSRKTVHCSLKSLSDQFIKYYMLYMWVLYVKGFSPQF